MKRYLFLLLPLMLSLASCSNDSNTSSGTAPAAAPAAPQTTADAATTTATTTTTTATTAPETTTAAPTQEELDFAAIAEYWTECRGGYIEEPYSVYDGENHTYDNEIAFFMAETAKLDNTVLGSISGEDDLIAKAREVFIRQMGQDYIDRVEADHVIKDGVEVEIVSRLYPPYSTEYYAPADIWYINPSLPTGKLADGTGINTIQDWPPFLLIKGEDGRIIGCRF